MKEKILKIGVIIALIATLVMTDFIWVGYGVVMAMYEELEAQNNTTNVKNVEFDAYFLNDGSKSHSKQGNIGEEQTLILGIYVKEKGVLNDAKIKIENSNFVILKDKVNSEYVKNIDLEKNEIELNQIIYQNNAEISLPISFNKEQEFKEDCFDKENTFSLTGTYKEEEKETNVEGNIKTRMIWTEQTDVNLSQGIEKFINLGEQGILLEQNITTEVIDNKLPRENETLEVKVPELEQKLPENVTVLYNGDKLAEDKVEYQKENKKLIVKNETKGIWGNAKNEYKVIYQYPEEIGIENKEITLKTSMATKLYTKEEIVKEDTKNVEISETGNIASISKTATESLEKGYMYAAGENATTYFETNKIEISNAKALEKVEVENQEESFLNEAGETFDISNKTNYLETTLNKENIQEILGENGIVTIYDGGQNTLAIINNQTEADENGNITITYEEPKSRIKIETSKPENEGTLIITNKKQIEGNTEYPKEQLKTFTSIVTKTKVATNLSEEIAEAKINLVDTKTEATISINNNNLSTLQKNENVQLLVTLKSNSAKYDLFKNPKIEIVLPKELNINVKNINQMNGQNELRIVNPKLYQNENGDRVISMDLQGEQKTFANDINEGIQIAITADIEIDITTPSKQAQIIMNYTNENKPGESFTATTDINLNSKYGLLTVNKLSNFNENQEVIENIDDKVKTGTLDENKPAREAKQEISIINNYETDITNIAIIGKIPGLEEEQVQNELLKSNFEMKLKQALVVEGKTAKIYYSEDSKAKVDSNTWKENVEDFSKIKAFKIEIEENKLKPLEELKISYLLDIPEGLTKNQETYTYVTVNYEYAGDVIQANSVISLKTEEQKEAVLKQEKTDKLLVELTGKTGGETLAEGQEVYEGQGIKYILKVTNTSQEEIKNFTMTATQSNSVFYDKKVYNDGWDSIEGDENVEYTRIEENPELTEMKRTVESIKPGESVELSYQFSVKEISGAGQSTVGSIKFLADGIEEKEIATLNNPIKTGKIKLQMRSKYEEEYNVLTNREYPFFLDVTNISDGTQNDITLNLPVPEGFEFDTESLFEAEDGEYEFIEYKNGVVTFRIPEINQGETISIRLGFQVLPMDTSIEQKAYSFTFSGTLGNETYVSNEMDRTIYNAESDIEARQYGSIVGEEVENGDELTYTAIIENKGTKEKFLEITDYLPDGVIPNKATIRKYQIVDGKENLVLEEDIEITNENEDGTQEKTDIIAYGESLAANEKFVLTIDTTIDTSKIFEEEITNEIEITALLQEIECNSVTYKVKGNENIDPNPDPEMTYDISGTAWVDENKNGLREEQEAKLKDIEVMLINEETGEIAVDFADNQIVAKTNENGEYSFTNVKQGKYIVVFKYDTTMYRVTEYQKEGVSQETNSDVISKTISLEGEEEQVAITGTLELTNNDIENIDAGFIEGEKFDLRLDKYINRVIIQDNKGTTVKQYDNTNFAKIDLDSKKLDSSTVIIEYSIKVTNEGELAGYVNEIADYIPNDLTFNSGMNQNWYQLANGELHSKELSNQIIRPGESKLLTLTLVKDMNQNNTGTTINTAEIYKASNDYSINDIDSTPANKVSGEDDISTVELIISISTGGGTMYISLILIIIAIIGVGIYLIKKRVLTDETSNEKENNDL